MNTKFPISLVKMLHDDGTDAFRLYVVEAQELLQYMEDKQKKLSNSSSLVSMVNSQ